MCSGMARVARLLVKYVSYALYTGGSLHVKYGLKLVRTHTDDDQYRPKYLFSFVRVTEKNQ